MHKTSITPNLGIDIAQYQPSQSGAKNTVYVLAVRGSRNTKRRNGAGSAVKWPHASPYAASPRLSVYDFPFWVTSVLRYIWLRVYQSFSKTAYTLRRNSISRTRSHAFSSRYCPCRVYFGRCRSLVTFYNLLDAFRLRCKWPSNCWKKG